MKLNNPKIWAVIVPVITALGGYFGYEPVQQLKSPPDVNIEVEIPAQPAQQHTHQDWMDAIERADKRAMDKHKDSYH